MLNQICSQGKSSINPEAGMGVTELHYSDRSAGTITRVSKSGKRFWFTRDTASRVDNNGMSDAQSYTFKSNPEGEEREVYRTQDGRWRLRGQGNYVRVGARDEHYDFSF